MFSGIILVSDLIGAKVLRIVSFIYHFRVFQKKCLKRGIKI